MTQFRSLSWGVGVQSTTLAVMSTLGDLDPLDVIITADTLAESEATYQTRGWYINWLRDHGQRVEMVSAGSVIVQGSAEHIHVPFWTSTGGPLQRQCTANFKIWPTKRRVREILGFHPSNPPHPKPGTVEQWLGISWDEWSRMSDSEVKFIKHRWPLIERKMTRNDCIDYLEAHRLPVPPKSACKICPYRQASGWLELSPAELQEAITFDQCNRHNPLAKRGNSTADELYIWRGLIPLSQVNFEAEAKKERKAKQLPLMICESGYCWT